ncbi:cysteine proteinase [Neocallimastix californiae]|jgi:ubiquitin C-terminal hydrolase|uniref:Ubiquitin carboxyl-terminal hydrolase n=1 Tax=Neocallimastix californiae TaxID=1754190 RepID=A0A1Y2ENL8_9FUNG|nr:cysteine proteinase [Neocallimastix californiae]|eukprot:ORY72796.1 cysteine proteinase [Neocallimastix californiae]
MSFLKWFTGSNVSSKSSRTEIKTLDERYLGFHNFGNTCYCNSILQALYHCEPFRECIQFYKPKDTIPILIEEEKYRRLFYKSKSTSTLNSKKNKFSKKINTQQTSSSSPNDNTSASLSPNLKPISSNLSISSISSTNNGGSLNTISSTDQKPPKLSKRSKKEIVTETLKIVKEFEAEESLLWELKSLFLQITTNKKKQGSVAPKRFIDVLQKKNEIFRGTMHQDAQEFLNYLLNSISESLSSYQNNLLKRWDQFIEEEENKKKAKEMKKHHLSPSQQSQPKSLLNVEEIPKKKTYSTWINELFEGILTNEIKCLNCENVTCRDESFFDLSVDVEHNTSLSACLKNFSSSERLCQKNKFYCDTCCGLQEAEKRMKIKRAPNILALHLKRFKYEEKLNRYVKLPYRVLFPTELRLSNMTDKAENPDRLYNLFAITIHIGNGPYHGHYVTVVRGNNTWLMCDDENVVPINDLVLQSYFGDLNNYRCGYIFFYQADNFTVDSMTTIRDTSKYKYSNSSKESLNDESIAGNLTNTTSALPPTVNSNHLAPPTQTSIDNSSVQSIHLDQELENSSSEVDNESIDLAALNLTEEANDNEN